MRHVLVVLAIWFGVAGSGRQAAADEVDARVVCVTGGKPVASKKKVTVGEFLSCHITVASIGSLPDGTTAVTWVSQVGWSKEPRKLAGALVIDDDETYFGFDDSFARTSDFRGCVDLTVRAQLAGPDGTVLFDGSVPIRTTCKKPRKVKAKLACRFDADDGTLFRWPGNGVKGKPRMETPVTCGVTVAKLASGDGMETTIGVKGRPGRVGGLGLLEGGAWYSEAALLPDADFDVCMPFMVTARIDNADGQPVWTGKQKLDQDCPD